MTGAGIKASKLVNMANRLKKRRIFMMGSGKSVQPKHTAFFCETIVSDCMDGKFCERSEAASAGVCCEEFALGFAACLDAVSRGTIDLEEHPRNVVNQAWNDMNNVTTRPNTVTDIMRIERG